jgi:hypothetical protein
MFLGFEFIAKRIGLRFKLKPPPIEITSVISGLINHQAALGLGMQKLTIELGYLDFFKTSI